MKKIDMHCHATYRPVGGVIDRDASLENILRYMDKYEIEKTVLLASYFPHKGSGISNYRLVRWIDRVDPNRDRFLMFGSLDVASYLHMGINELRDLAAAQLIHGIKVYTCYQDIDIHSNKFVEVMGLAHSYGFPVMFHTGHSYACRRKYGKDSPAQLYTAQDFQDFASQWRDVSLILSHMSKPFFKEILDLCRTHANVYTDMSGIIDSSYDEDDIPACIEEIKLFLHTVGHSRLLFGTDFPVQTHEHSVRFVEEATHGMGDYIREAIYRGNAVDLLGLKQRQP